MSALHAFVAEGLQNDENTVGALEAEGLFSNMKQLQFGILTELFSSLLEQFSTTSSALGLPSPRLDLNDAVPMLSSPSYFFQSQRDLFHQIKNPRKNDIGNVWL